MDLRTASDAYESISKTSLRELHDDLLELAVRYARLRVDWQLATQEARRELDGERSAAHTAFIEACNILSRNMVSVGERNEWRRTLGTDRKELGDFACYLHCLIGLAGR